MSERITVGERLPNGAYVIAMHTERDRPNPDHVVVLALMNGEYVTWKADAACPESTSWGHYLGSNFAEAVNDFYQRAERGSVDFSAGAR